MNEQPVDPMQTAMDRVQQRESEDVDTEFSWKWLGGIALLVLGIVGVWLWTQRGAALENDLLREAVAASREFRPSEITNDPDMAASWVFDNLEGWLVFPPEIAEFELLGVGSAELTPSVFVPGFRYDGTQGATFVVYAYDYILLDEAANSGRLRLAPAVYARLAEPEPVDIRRQGDAYVVTWRRRATIFTAVAPGEELAERISQAVRRPEL